jgi:Ran GTPase-activating protein (RanGAP) involved in mRNA processing and transport
LADGISISTSILHLNLAKCSLTDDGGEAIVQSLLINEVCNELNLSDNHLSLKTAKALAEVFAENKSLRRLDLSRNMLCEDEAIAELMKGLVGNATLEELDLSWNGLRGDDSLRKTLLKSIKLSRLRVLNLENNQLSSVELRRIAIGLKRSETIEEAYIGGNLITEDVDAKLIGVFASESPLRLMSFGSWFHLSREAFKVRNVLVVLDKVFSLFSRPTVAFSFCKRSERRSLPSS